MTYFVEMNGFKEASALSLLPQFRRRTFLKPSTVSEFGRVSSVSRIQEQFSRKRKTVEISKLLDAT